MKKISSYIIVPLLIAITFLFSNHIVNQEESESVLFPVEIAEDATPDVLARIKKVGDNPVSEIKFEKGTYHFYPDKGQEYFRNISNHGDHLIRTAFPLIGLKNLTIDGQGSTFIFHGIMIPFLVDRSEGITIKNLSIDWAETFHSEGQVVANNLKGKTFDMKISEQYPYEIRNDQLYFIKEYYEHTIGQSILYDPNRSAIAFDTESYTNLTTVTKVKNDFALDKVNYKYKADPNEPPLKWRGREWRLKVEPLGPGLVRVHNHGKKIPPVGMIVSMKGEQGINRVSPAFHVTHTDQFNALNVNVHHAGGMGLIAENSSDLILDNFNVTPSRGRMVSTTADATHFVGCRGKVVLKNCTFNNQLDDATNVHGTYQEVMDILGAKRIGIRSGHFQQLGFTIGRIGDQIGLVRLEDSFFPYGKLTLQHVERINSRYQILTFKENIPANLKPGDLIENLDAYPELLVENCNIGKNRARGLLISTPKKTVIRNNTFHTEMEAILVPVESSHWYESGSASNLSIIGNTFQDCVHSGQNRGVIRFVTDDENENIAFTDIDISHNQFNQFDNLILEVNNTKGLSFEDNTIRNSGSFPQLFPENPVIKVKAAQDIRFDSNQYLGKAKTIIESDQASRNKSKLVFQ
ncbi:MAG: right-handed parallel beta-helix repeat-containing protein [Cyclobacteriaceae bacterium]